MTCEARDKVFELGEFDLKLTLEASCPPSKNVEDQLAAVNYPNTGLSVGPKPKFSL